MGQVEITIALPAEVAALLGETGDTAARAARQAVILQLLREGTISQGRAATLLDVTLHDILDLMATYDIPSGPQTIEEYRREVEQAARMLSRRTEGREGATRA